MTIESMLQNILALSSLGVLIVGTQWLKLYLKRQLNI